MSGKTIIDQFRELLPAVDPAALTGADRLALLDLAQASMAAAGIE
jgi:hypothetical protein